MVFGLTWPGIAPTIFRSKRSYLLIWMQPHKTKQDNTDPTIGICMFMLSFTFICDIVWFVWVETNPYRDPIRRKWLGSHKLYCWSSLFKIYFYHVLLFCVYLRPVSCVANVFNVSGLSILSWPSNVYFFNISMINGQTCLIETILSFPCTRLYLTCVYHPWSS